MFRARRSVRLPRVVWKIFAREELLHGKVLPESNQIEQRQLGEPLAVVADFSFTLIQHSKRLLGIRLGILGDLLLCENRSRFIFIRRVADERSVTADEERHLVSQILKLAQFAHGDSVTQMQIGGRSDRNRNTRAKVCPL